MDEPRWQVVAELPSFTCAAARCLDEEEKDAVIELLACFPEAGALIPGTGGARKARFAVGDKGKSGGVRVIYYFHSERLPVYLLTVYPKSRKANLTGAERNAIATTIQALLRARGLP